LSSGSAGGEAGLFHYFVGIMFLCFILYAMYTEYTYGHKPTVYGVIVIISVALLDEYYQREKAKVEIF